KGPRHVPALAGDAARGPDDRLILEIRRRARDVVDRAARDEQRTGDITAGESITSPRHIEQRALAQHDIALRVHIETAARAGFFRRGARNRADIAGNIEQLGIAFADVHGYRLPLQESALLDG